MHRLAWLIAFAACGGRAPRPMEPRLVTSVEHSVWYRSPVPCGQGPYELAIPAGPVSKWGEQVELRVHAPRGVALHAVLVVDGAELTHANGTFDRAQVDNTRCLADKRERVALGHVSGGSTRPGVPVPTGTPVPATTTTTTTAQLEISEQAALESTSVLSIRLPEQANQIVLRIWSIEPNDLEGVLFGVTKVAFAPNVSEAEYEAHLARLERETRERDERARLKAEREEAERARKRRANPAPPPREVVVRPDPPPRVVVAKPPTETPRRYAAELDARRREREQFCATHPEDARCWSSDRWERYRKAVQDRLAAAQMPAAKPDGPPPAPLVEEVPPKLSAHATWRQGYWHWLDGTWVWLAGMWRVPEEDIVAEQTTTAPAAPPPLRTETPPPAPVRAAVWVTGFWQWNGTSWVWIAGSYQLPPARAVTWRAAEWRPRGNVHVLVPGGWIRLGGAR